MNEPDLFEAFVDMANSTGEDFNDGDLWPGWMTAQWVENGGLEITYETPDNVKTSQRFQVIRIES